jgi:hypothetical protein
MTVMEVVQDLDIRVWKARLRSRMKAKLIRKALKTCSNCKLNNCFREDECCGCWYNEYKQYKGRMDLYELREDLESELANIEELSAMYQGLCN